MKHWHTVSRKEEHTLGCVLISTNQTCLLFWNWQTRRCSWQTERPRLLCWGLIEKQAPPLSPGIGGKRCQASFRHVGSTEETPLFHRDWLTKRHCLVLWDGHIGHASFTVPDWHRCHTAFARTSQQPCEYLCTFFMSCLYMTWKEKCTLWHEWGLDWLWQIKLFLCFR